MERILLFTIAAIVFYRLAREGVKRWCPNCRRFCARHEHEQERPDEPYRPGHFISVTYRRCPWCRYERRVRGPYPKIYSRLHLWWDRNKSNVYRL